VFTLQGVPVSHNFVDRSSDMSLLDQHLLPQGPHSQENHDRRVFVLHGLGGIGKTQLAANFARRHKATYSSIFWLDGKSEDRLKQSLAGCAKRMPNRQIPSRGDKDDLDIMVADVLEWLARSDNTGWLLIFDNVDQDYEQGGATGKYDIRQYLPGDHGTILITTRLSRLAQLGASRRLLKVDLDVAKAIFEKWYGKELGNSSAVHFRCVTLLICA
jgi:hypothetical protein